MHAADALKDKPINSQSSLSSPYSLSDQHQAPPFHNNVGDAHAILDRLLHRLCLTCNFLGLVISPNVSSSLAHDCSFSMCRPCYDIDESQTRDVSTNSTSTICAEHACCTETEHSQNGFSKWELKSLAASMACTSVHEDINPDPSQIHDIEEGLSLWEHVTLRFHGSNCPGCITEISAALNKMSNVHNANINAILMQIDLDIDLTNSSVNDVIASIQKSIGRAFQTIGDGLQRLDIFLSVVECDLADIAFPLGIKDITRKGKDTYCVQYNPKIIGARQVLKTLSKNKESPATLLPLISRRDVPSDIRMSVYRTSLSFALTCLILVLAWAPLPSHPITYGTVSLVLASVIQIRIAGPFCARALRNL